MSNCHPKLPLLLLHPKVLWRRSKKTYYYWINQRWYYEGTLKKDTYVLDLECRKWQILDVVLLRKSYDITTLLFKSQQKYRHFKVRYVYGPPVQLTFEEAKSEIVERVCVKRWYRQISMKEHHLRERIAQCKNAEELFDEAQFFGHVPPI
jgi:hypothetical protein